MACGSEAPTVSAPRPAKWREITFIAGLQASRARTNASFCRHRSQPRFAASAPRKAGPKQHRRRVGHAHACATPAARLHGFVRRTHSARTLGRPPLRRNSMYLCRGGGRIGRFQDMRVWGLVRGWVSEYPTPLEKRAQAKGEALSCQPTASTPFTARPVTAARAPAPAGRRHAPAGGRHHQRHSASLVGGHLQPDGAHVHVNLWVLGGLQGGVQGSFGETLWPERVFWADFGEIRWRLCLWGRRQGPRQPAGLP